MQQKFSKKSYSYTCIAECIPLSFSYAVAREPIARALRKETEKEREREGMKERERERKRERKQESERDRERERWKFSKNRNMTILPSRFKW